MLDLVARALPRRAAVRLLALVAILALPLPAAARQSVDPATLTPPPNPATNPTCGWAGQQVICSTDIRFTVTDEPTGILCDDGELLESSERHVVAQRVYDANLRMTKRRFQERIDGILYVAETGELVHWTGTDGGISTLGVPGDPTTGTVVNTGAIIHLYPADGGSISIAGRFVEDLDTGDFRAVGSNLSGVDFCDLIG